MQITFYIYITLEKRQRYILNIASKNTSILLQTYVLLVQKKIIYLSILHILSANSEQTHHTLVSYEEVRMIKSRVVCDY